MDLECDNKIKQVFFIFNFKGTFRIRKDLRDLTLLGFPRDNQELDPLAVLHQLCMMKNFLFRT